MKQTSFITSKGETQSGQKKIVESMHCINYAKREQEKPLLFKLTLRSRFTLSGDQSLLSRAISCDSCAPCGKINYVYVSRV